MALLALQGCNGQPVESQSAGSAPTEQGCEPFVIYAQNRFQPAGAAGRVEPSIDAAQTASFAANQELTAIGYIKAETPAYPHNDPGIQGYLWYLVQSNAGLVYVNDAAVRAATTEQDPTGGYSDDLGPLVTSDENCDLNK